MEKTRDCREKGSADDGWMGSLSGSLFSPALTKANTNLRVSSAFNKIKNRSLN